MRGLRHWLLILLSICSLSALAARTARAQAVYQAAFLDDNSDLGTESLLEDCEEGGCGCSTSVSSTFNGEQVGLPAGIAEYQYVDPATPDTEYVWTISGETTCCYPLVGCEEVPWGWTGTVQYTNTWYGPANLQGDTCYYYNQSTGAPNLYCTQGKPYCIVDEYQIAHNIVGVNTCPTTSWYQYLVTNGGQECDVASVQTYFPGDTIPTTRICN